MSDTVLLTGSFNPRLKTYMLFQCIGVLMISVVGIPLLLLIPVISMVINRHYLALSCEMTEKFLKVRKGVFVKIEKNVPLEQITDMGIVEGPLMRLLGIKALSVETAGQSSQGALVKLLALDEIEEFRDKVLRQRDNLRKTTGTQREPTDAADSAGVQERILATLERIEVLLGK
jgi:putative membrane protein